MIFARYSGPEAASPRGRDAASADLPLQIQSHIEEFVVVCCDRATDVTVYTKLQKKN